MSESEMVDRIGPFTPDKYCDLVSYAFKPDYLKAVENRTLNKEKKKPKRNSSSKSTMMKEQNEENCNSEYGGLYPNTLCSSIGFCNSYVCSARREDKNFNMNTTNKKDSKQSANQKQMSQGGKGMISNGKEVPSRNAEEIHGFLYSDHENWTTEKSEKIDKEGKQKIWTDKREKWSHDKFNYNDQAPKSRAELIAIYGYDIRKEEGPPRARTSRRYGRGPNKYTRNWEDEDAYNKPPAVKGAIQKKQKPPTNSKVDSPIETHNIMNAEESNVTGKQPDNYSERASTESPQQMAQSSKAIWPKEEIAKANNSAQNAERQNDINKMQTMDIRGIVVPTREIKESDYRGITKPRIFSFAPKPAKEVYKEDTIHAQNITNKTNIELEIELGKLSLQEQQRHSKTNIAQYMSNLQVSVPPRLQAEQKGSKRYSSIRQRSLPESVTPPFNQQHYYGNEYAQQNHASTNQPSNQAIIQHQGAQIRLSPGQIPSIPPPPLPTMTQQVPVTSTPLLPQFMAPFPQGIPSFLQPPPPSFLPQQSAPIINYVQSQLQYLPPQPPYQGFQQPFNPVSQPTEIFQPHGGITYYSAYDQLATQRGEALQKRLKSAIPIVPPPPLEPRGRGRLRRVSTQESTPNSNEVFVESYLEKL